MSPKNKPQKNICNVHESDFSDIVACNDCNMLSGFMLKHTRLGAIYLNSSSNTLWPTKEEAVKFAKKYAIYKEWKPIQVYVHFD